MSCAAQTLTCDEAKVDAWIERCVCDAPPLGDAQLRRIGDILGVTLTRKPTATPA